MSPPAIGGVLKVARIHPRHVGIEGQAHAKSMALSVGLKCHSKAKSHHEEDLHPSGAIPAVVVHLCHRLRDLFQN